MIDEIGGMIERTEKVAVNVRVQVVVVAVVVFEVPTFEIGNQFAQDREEGIWDEFIRETKI